MAETITVIRKGRPAMLFTYEERTDGWGKGFFCQGRKHLYKIRFDNDWCKQVWIAYCHPGDDFGNAAYCTIEAELRAVEIVTSNGRFIFGDRSR